MDISESIHMKRAVRQYAQQSIPEDIVHHMHNSGRRAQSATCIDPPLAADDSSVDS